MKSIYPLVSILLFFLFGFFHLHGQTEIDSIRKVLKTDLSDTVRVKMLERYADITPDTSEARAYVQKAISLSKKIGYQKGIAVGYAVEGGTAFDYSHFAEATYWYTEALRINIEISNKHGMAQAYHELALLDIQFKNEIHARENIRKAIALNTETKNYRWLRNNYMTLSTTYQDMKQYDSAMLYSYSAESVAYKHNLSKAVIYHNRADLYLETKQLDSVELYIRKSDLAYDSIQNSYGHVWNKMDTGALLIQKGKSKEAIPLLLDVYRFAQDNVDGELLFAVLPVLIDAYRHDQDYREGFLLQDKWQKLHDSLSNSDNANMALGIQLNLEEEQRTKIEKIEKKRNEEIHQAESDRQKTIIYSVSVFLLLCIGIIFLVLRNNRQKEKTNRIISIQKQLVEEKQKEILDSIHYAKRIQQSLLPTEKYIDRQLKRISGNKS